MSFFMSQQGRDGTGSSSFPGDQNAGSWWAWNGNGNRKNKNKKKGGFYGPNPGQINNPFMAGGGFSSKGPGFQNNAFGPPPPPEPHSSDNTRQFHGPQGGTKNPFHFVSYRHGNAYPDGTFFRSEKLNITVLEDNKEAGDFTPLFVRQDWLFYRSQYFRSCDDDDTGEEEFEHITTSMYAVRAPWISIRIPKNMLTERGHPFIRNCYSFLVREEDMVKNSYVRGFYFIPFFEKKPFDEIMSYRSKEDPFDIAFKRIKHRLLMSRWGYTLNTLWLFGKDEEDPQDEYAIYMLSTLTNSDRENLERALKHLFLYYPLHYVKEISKQIQDLEEEAVKAQPKQGNQMMPVPPQPSLFGGSTSSGWSSQASGHFGNSASMSSTSGFSSWASASSSNMPSIPTSSFSSWYNT